MKSVTDPRTHLVTLLIATIFVFTIHQQQQLHFLMAISILYVFIEKGLRRAISFLIAYVVVSALVQLLSYGAGGIAAAMYLFVRMMPLFAIGNVLATSPASTLLYVSDKMKFPRNVVIMVCILLRFSSMIYEEISSIRQGIRARGLLPHWYSIFLHPVQSYECFVLPLIIRGLKLSNELTCAAEFRGIESKCQRSSIYPLSVWYKNFSIVIGYSFLGLIIWYWAG